MAETGQLAAKQASLAEEAFLLYCTMTYKRLKQLFPLRLRGTLWRLAGLQSWELCSALESLQAWPHPCLCKSPILGAAHVSLCLQLCSTLRKLRGVFPPVTLPRLTRSPIFSLHSAYLCLRQVPHVGPISHESGVFFKLPGHKEFSID